jgi:hypothetical protein
MSDPQAGECPLQSRWKSWRGEVVRQPDREKPDAAPSDPLPDELWDAVLSDPRAAGKPWLPIQQLRLSEIPRHVLRVECSRCFRIVEIEKPDAVKFYGPHAVWKDVGQRLLDQTCTNRTGRHEEDGCWPDWTK